RSCAAARPRPAATSRGRTRRRRRACRPGGSGRCAPGEDREPSEARAMRAARRVAPCERRRGAAPPRGIAGAQRAGGGRGVVGGVLSLAIGVFAAVLPTTPTWALWRIKNAVDANDVRGLTEMVDIPAVMQHAVTDLDAAKGGFDLGQAAAAVFAGGKVLTV